MIKITRPVLKGIYLRERLFNELDNRGPAVWISAPAGAGKTTVVSSYIATRERSCLWYQLDPGDADPATFFYYLGLAARKAAPRYKKPLPLLTPEYQPSLALFARRFFEELYGRLKAPAIIVFDNYQDAPADAPLHALIEQAISALPEGMRMMVLSREDLPASFIRLKANRHLELIGGEDLRLTLEEAQGVVSMHERTPTAPEAIQRMYTITNGWTAGLVLLSGIKDQADITRPFSDSLEEIFTYFAHEVFERLDDQAQDFFLKTSLLPVMTVNMAAELSGVPGAGRILRHLSRNNYFTTIHPGIVPYYEYHPLYRTFLQLLAKDLFPPSVYTSLLLEAARLLEQGGQVDDALTLVRDAGGWEIMLGFLMLHAPAMLQQGRHSSLEKWLAAKPSEIVAASPWLRLWRAMSRFPFDPLASVPDLEAAYISFKTADDLPGFFLAWAGLAGVFSFNAFAGSRGDDLIADLEARREQFDRLASEEIHALVASTMAAILTVRHPEHPETEDWLRLAMDLARRTGGTNSVDFLFTMIPLYYCCRGTLKQVEEAIMTIREIIANMTSSEFARIGLHLAETMYFNLCLDHARCRQAADAGMELARTSGIHLLEVMTINHAILCCQSVGDQAGTAHYLTLLAPSRNDPRPWMQSVIHMADARQAIIQGDTPAILPLIERMFTFEEASGAPYTYCLELTFSAQIMLELGEREHAAELLSRAKALAMRLDSPLCKINLDFVQAQQLFDAGDDMHALERLGEALHLSKAWGGYGFFDVPASATRLYARALEAGIETDFVREIIRRRNLIPTELPLNLESWPWPVKIYALGDFRIVRDDVPVSFARKTQKMPLEMLKVLVANSGGISEIAMADLLWPDADGDLAFQSCATTRYRLRKLLGQPEALTIRDGHMALDPRWCWVDAWACECLLDSAQTFRHNGSQEQACRLTEQSLALYRGRFLEREPENSCTVSTSERLRSKFLQGVRYLAQCHENAGELEKAAQYYARCLDIDDCVEEVYQHLMRCHHHLGRHDEALGVYRRCDHTFKTVFGIKPSGATEQLRDAILSERK